MDLLSKVRDALWRYQMVERQELVVVAVSGGPDSVALLHLLYSLMDELGISLHVAHLNHMFRGAEAEEDAFFVAGLAKSYRLSATIEAIDVPAYRKATGLSAQTAAREVRYLFLQEVAQKNGAGKIALAHQADDQAETVLINFLRGAGTTGLKGILPVRDNFFIRPLLMARRTEIENYCREKKLSFRHDSSNLKPVYLRNRVRMELLPLLESEYNPAIVALLLRLGDICREEDAYLEELARTAYRSVAQNDGNGTISLELARLREMPRAILRRVFRLAWRDLVGGEPDLSFTHTKALLDLLDNDAGPGTCASLPAGGRATRSYKALHIFTGCQKPQVGSFQYLLQVPGTTYIPELACTVRADLTTPNRVPQPRSLPPSEALLDCAKLPLQIFVRQRLPGDLFCPFGSRKAVKLKDFLIKQKVPRAERDYLPLISTPEEIIWVGGIRIGEKWKIEEDTKKVLHLKVTK